MKINNISIHNFRGILDARFELSGYSLIIGANNGGKSTLIDAIRCFYEKDGFKFDPAKDVPKVGGSDEESWVEITYSLSEEENESLKEEYRSTEKKLCLRKYLKSKEKAKTGAIFFKSSSGEVSSDSFYGAKNVQCGKIGELIYIPAISKVDEQTKLSGPSSLRDLLNYVVSGVIEKSLSYREFCSSVERFSSAALYTTSEEKESVSLDRIQQEMNKFLSSWNTKFSLRFSPPSATDLVKNMVAWSLHDKDLKFDQDISRCGSGFQRHFIYSLISMGARFLARKTSSKPKDFTPDFTLILFEEPEAFLHPEKQEDLARDLQKLGKEENRQVICTSHSPHFVSRSMDEIHSIIRVARDAGIVSVHQITRSALNNIFQANVNNPKQQGNCDEVEKEAIRYAMWMDPHRAGAFCADKVLLVEGPTETVFINRLQDDGEIPRMNGVFVLDCFGKYNIHRFMAILGALGISHSVLIDSDSGKAQHQEWNSFIQGQKNSCTKKIHLFQNDLEGFLGIAKPKENALKPLSLLIKYEHREISSEKKKEFFQLLWALFN